LRNQMRSRRRLRVVTLVSLAAIVLIVLPVFFGLRSAGRDPVFTSLDSLDVPSWAQTKVDDRSSGSQWCFMDCRFRERTADSTKPLKETTAAYNDALKAAGWQSWKVAECPEQPIDPASGTYSCWKRDEFTLDLQVSLPDCAVDALAAQDPAALPSAAVAPAEDPKKCVGSTVSMKVQNAISDTRGKREPKQSPDLIGETPDPTFSDDPLLGTPTPSAS
jgi:integrin beta 3